MSIESSLFAFPVLSYQHLKIAINASMGESDVLEFRFYALLFYRSAFFKGMGVFFTELFLCFSLEKLIRGGSRGDER